MRKVRFLISVVASMILMLGLTACGGKTADTGTQNSTQNVDSLTENNETPATDVTEPGVCRYAGNESTAPYSADHGSSDHWIYAEYCGRNQRKFE